MSDISVTIVAATNASVSILNDDAVSVSAGPGFVGGGATALMVEAGANITVTTAYGSYIVSGRSPATILDDLTNVTDGTTPPPLGQTYFLARTATQWHATVVSVPTLSNTAAQPLGVVASAGDQTLNVAARADHVHPLPTISYTSLSDIPTSFASSAHTHAATDITNLTAVANVVNVNGITGTPTIVAGSNVTVVTAGSSITISASGGGGTTGGAVSSVNGKTGTVVLTSVDVSAASASHTHVAANITDLTNVANVVSVNGKTGTVSLVATDVSAASASHTHVAANITDLTNVANVVSVNGKTGTVSLIATDLTAASATHGHSYVTSLNGSTGDLTVVAGSNITVTTSAGSIVIVGPTVTQGPAGPPGSFGDPQAIQALTASYTLQLADVGTLLTLNGSATATASAFTVTIPSSSSVSWVAGSHIDVARIGAQGVQVAGQGGVSVIATPSAALRDTGSAGTLVYLGSNTWLMVGDLA